MLVGHIKELVRHPVKSFFGESVQETRIMDYGLYGDRSHAFLDETRKNKFLTITQFPEMVRYKARFSGEESLDRYPNVEITTPKGSVVAWGDEELIKELEERSQRKLLPVSYTPTHVPLGPIEEEHLQLVTDASLDKLKELAGKQMIEHRRFRPNLYLSLIEKNPFVEETWFGKRMKIGDDVEIQLLRHCERCSIITYHPENAERDASLLKTVAKERQNHFGVYASAIKTGTVRVGDAAYLVV
ncbi:MOSC domain-containing protein [Fictibacillus sp. S7]|uniref:MOSC domain-containing protein n=1 Tax=Fictibacillus sp. S7 TaxID=2212476 RepID=UPI0010133A2F|nr:MOSC domain-containing protein [Fictibacillus sp. S7]RXZ00696.1 MOSC domain-containing protein [Fictibacillus sp. S7]